jgi:predicted negative regulator of RcsB-dependent stress response
VDRLTRKELKTDEVAQKLFGVFEWSSHHRSLVYRAGGAVLALAVIGLAYYFYSNSQATVRQEALAKALRIDEATTGTNVQAASLHYETPEEKDKAVAGAFSDVATRFNGTQEGSIAEIYLGGAAAEKGNLAQAEKHFKNVVDSGPKNYAALARLSLGQVYAAEGKTADAEKILREAMSNPAGTASKEQAELTLAQILAPTNPTEARKLLEPLRTISARPAVTKAAISLGAEIPNTVK